MIPAFNAFKIPDNISDDLASIFDPFGNAVHTALSFDRWGRRAGLRRRSHRYYGGCRGEACGCAQRGDHRRERIPPVAGAQMGVTRAVDVSKESLTDVMEELGMTEGFDVGLEMSGAPPAFRTMLDTMNHGGRIAMLGIPPSDMSIDWNKVIFKGLFIKGIYGREMFETGTRWPR